MTEVEPRDFLRHMFASALAAVTAEGCVPPHLPPPPPAGRTIVIGAGKAAAAMARVVERHWRGPLSGLVVTRYGHGIALERIALIEAAHPVPDAAGESAARRILTLMAGLSAEDLVLCLISGGGSALMALPAEGVALADKQGMTSALLHCGATIAEINCVRKHLSAIKGGRLAAAAFPARVVTLAISDVPGDDPATIASGPTVADPTTLEDARAILAKYRIEAPKAVVAHLCDGASETPKPGDPRLARSEFRIVARAADALAAAAACARALGIRPLIQGDAIEGEARDVAAAHAARACELARNGESGVLLSGGETTVTIASSGGRGGRNSEYLLALALALDGAAGIYALACDTDGIDGTEDCAGALIGPDSLARARASGLDPARALGAHDSHTIFMALGDLVVTGPTRTNVNDFRAILIAASRARHPRL